MGEALLHGKGVQQNVPEALKWLHTAADRVPLLAAVSTASAHVRACVRVCVRTSGLPGRIPCTRCISSGSIRAWHRPTRR